MSDNSDAKRDAIHTVLQANGPLDGAALLTGWAVVAEWMDADGDKWLTKTHSASIATWAAKGMHYEAINGFQDTGRGDDE
jgi:hypothetical protein